MFLLGWIWFTMTLWWCSSGRLLENFRVRAFRICGRQILMPFLYFATSLRSNGGRRADKLNNTGAIRISKTNDVWPVLNDQSQGNWFAFNPLRCGGGSRFWQWLKPVAHPHHECTHINPIWGIFNSVPPRCDDRCQKYLEYYLSISVVHTDLIDSPCWCPH